MKKIRLLIGGLLFALSSIVVHAQVDVEVTAGTVPGWAPEEGTGARYYYIPDVEAYYDVNTATYIYLTDGKWVHSRHLPPRYEHYDLYGGYKVVLGDYRGERPYDEYERHHKDYPRGYNNHGQVQKMHGEKRDEHREQREEHHDERH